MTPGGMMLKDIGKMYVHMTVFSHCKGKLKSICATHSSTCQEDLANINPICPGWRTRLASHTLSTREYSRRWGLGWSARGEWPDVTRPKCSEKPHGSAWT